MSTPKATLVLLHGFLGSSEDWQPVIHRLSGQFNCIAVNIEVTDIAAEQSLSFSERCQQLFYRLEHEYQFPETFSVLGYSMGGRIALCWSNLFADRITSLILESCHMGLTDETELQQRLDHDNQWLNRFNSEPLDAVLRSWYQQPVFLSLSSAQKEQLIQYRCSIMTPQKLQLIGHFSLGLQPDYSLLSLPDNTHFICGQQDSKFLNIGQQLKSKNSTMQLYQFPESGHNVHLDCLNDYSKLVSTLIN